MERAERETEKEREKELRDGINPNESVWVSSVIEMGKCDKPLQDDCITPRR